jgi:hypothetical protein
MSSHRRRFERARPAVVWTVVGFAAIQLALNVTVIARHPEAQDPEYAERLALLRARMAEGPDRPLCLVVGSSRVVKCFVPELLPPLPAAGGAPPLVFNFAHLGAGPGMNLVELRRLQREGVRPKWLVLEVMPPQLGDAKQSIVYGAANYRDLSVTRHFHHPFQVYGDFLRRDWATSYRYRQLLAAGAVPGWVPAAEVEQGKPRLLPLGGPTDLPAPDPEYTRVSTEKARGDYQLSLRNFEIAGLSDRALREALRACKRRDVTVVLLLTPEGTAFRSWYPPGALETIDAYCRNLSREYGVPLVDARGWVADAEFIDSHHVNVAGAITFTERLNREVLTPLVEGRLSAPAPLK